MDTIDHLRAFSRFYTGRLGLLGKSYLGSGLGVAEVRLLHDLDAPEPKLARGLAQDLRLDEGYVSRALKGFERRGWIARRVAADGRAREVTLTDAGRAIVADLRAQSRAALAPLVAPLPPAQQAAMVGALTTVKDILSGDPAPVVLRDLEPGDGGWVIERHGEHYAAEEGYDARFEALVAGIVAGFLSARDPARERGWIAARGAVRLGSVFVVSEAPDIAKLRLFLIEPAVRGTGLAQRMLEAAIDFARGAGYARMRLWTHESHRAAGRVYARNGFLLVDSQPGQAFGQAVVDQIWERAL